MWGFLLIAPAPSADEAMSVFAARGADLESGIGDLLALLKTACTRIAEIFLRGHGNLCLKFVLVARTAEESIRTHTRE